MLGWAIGFFIAALVAAVFGFGGIASAFTGIAIILFWVFLALFVLSLLFNTFGGAHVAGHGGRTPALLIRTSTRPNASSAHSTILLPSSTLSVEITASPPPAQISSATVCASRAAPLLEAMSFTTTRAPRRANSSAYARPSPCPAPVMTTTRSSNLRFIARSSEERCIKYSNTHLARPFVRLPEKWLSAPNPSNDKSGEVMPASHQCRLGMPSQGSEFEERARRSRHGSMWLQLLQTNECVPHVDLAGSFSPTALEADYDVFGTPD